MLLQHIAPGLPTSQAQMRWARRMYVIVGSELAYIGKERILDFDSDPDESLMDELECAVADGSLTFEEILLLDRVQKRLPLRDQEAKLLRDRSLIEGRKPNYYIAKTVAQQTGQKAEYSKNSAFEKQYYLDFICKAIDEHGEMARRDVDKLIWDILPVWMDEAKRRNRIENLLRELRKTGKIVNVRRGAESIWKRPPDDRASRKL